MKSLKTIYTLFFLVTALAVSIQAQSQITETPILELLSKMADKPKDHKAIADYYQKLAAQARKEAGLHEKIKENYRLRYQKMKDVTVGSKQKIHCDRIIKLQISVAEEYESLAELHEKLAKQ